MKDLRHTAPSAVLQDARIRSGQWLARLDWPGEGVPQIALWDAEAEIAPVDVVRAGDGWELSVTIPVAHLSDGWQTFLVREASGTTLGHFSLLAGAAPDADLRAEIAALRAEVDLLKRAVRRLASGHGD